MDDTFQNVKSFIFGVKLKQKQRHKVRMFQCIYVNKQIIDEQMYLVLTFINCPRLLPDFTLTSLTCITPTNILTIERSSVQCFNLVKKNMAVHPHDLLPVMSWNCMCLLCVLHI